MHKPKYITSADTADNFVGIRFINNAPVVIFPHGFNIPKEESERRKDAFRLLYVLQQFGKKRDGNNIRGESKEVSQFPITSYQYVIQDYLSHGYYAEKETVFKSDSRGKISWKRTIQKEKPQLSNGNVVYLNYQVKKELNNLNRLITQIHKYCVYQSFYMFGWLYFTSDFLPPKPEIKLNVNLFNSVLKNELNHTFDDKKKKLFRSMINIINTEQEDINYNNWSLGVNHFAGVWERLINYVFGEDDKKEYFPHATWTIIKDGNLYTSSALEPDTIMLYKDNYYILDAKYYQYGITDDPADLPATSSIQKQITYAEHLEKRLKNDLKGKIYNAFVMPFNMQQYVSSGKTDTEQKTAEKNKEYMLRFVAVGEADWHDYDIKNDTQLNYSYILGMLLDTRHLITTFTKHNGAEIEKLATKIEDSVKYYMDKKKEQEKTEAR